MKICPNKNCRATVFGNDARFCPKCGIRFPGIGNIKIVEYDKWLSLKKKSQPSKGKTRINREEYNRIVNLYNDMVKNGYVSPLGDKEIISSIELQQLQNKSNALKRWKRECERKRNTPQYYYEDKYTNSFYWGNALLGIVMLGAIVFWLFFGIPTISEWVTGYSDKARIEIVKDESTGKYGIINHQIDSLVTPCVYDSINRRWNDDWKGKWNYYLLSKDGKYAFADSAGVNAVTELFDSITHINGSDVFMLYKGDKQGLMSGYGRLILNAEFYRVLWNYHGKDANYDYYYLHSPKNYVGNIIPAKVSKDDKWEIFNREGKKITYEKFYDAEQVRHPDLIKVATSYDNWGLMDKKGMYVLPCSYKNIYMFNEDIAWIKKSWKMSTTDPWTCISPTGEKLGTLPTNYQPLDGFSSGMSPIWNSKAPSKANIGYCNSKCQIVIPAKYGYFESKKNGTTYLSSLEFRGDSAQVSYQGKNGILRKDGTFKEKEL